MFGHVHHLQKNNTQLIKWWFLTIQRARFTSGAFQTFAEAYLWSLVSASAKKKKKKNTETIIFLGILKKWKKYFSKNKCTFFLQKSNGSLNKKVIFVFHTIFKLDLITQIIYCFIYRCLYSLFTFFLFSYNSLQETEHRNNVNPSLFIQLAKVQQQNEWKKKLGILEYRPWICNQAN